MFRRDAECQFDVTFAATPERASIAWSRVPHAPRMASPGRIAVCCCFYVLLLTNVVTFAQDPVSSGSRYYNRDGVYVPQDGYRTYLYKDRRYGYQPSYLDPIYRGPTRAPEDRYLYDVSKELYGCAAFIYVKKYFNEMQSQDAVFWRLID